ncbi:hypothetical protein [Streptomyces sp. NPDC099088]|uniref:hypothetical protein n=1 Tax=Streptomyces sp. NPDC099088 TaxID=3366101 RepID=UPI003807620C
MARIADGKPPTWNSEKWADANLLDLAISEWQQRLSSAATHTPVEGAPERHHEV